MVFSGQVTSNANLSVERRVLTDKLKILSRLLLGICILNRGVSQIAAGTAYNRDCKDIVWRVPMCDIPYLQMFN